MIEPTWAERNWSKQERQRLGGQLDQFSAEELREIIATVLDSDDPQYAAADLRAAINGVAGRIEIQRKREQSSNGN